MDDSTSSRKVVGLSLDFFVCLFVRLFRRMEKCMKSKGFFIFYILDNEGEVAESTKVIGKLGEIEHEMRFHNLCEEMRRNNNVTKMDLRE